MKRTKEPATIVVFRVWNDVDSVIALMPNEDAGNSMCMSYMHVGQHSGANYSHVISKTRPATKKEYKDLAQELTKIGYNLVVRKRRTR
jgi:hypothetical protein